MAIYVVGHKNPDTDSVVSAIALEYLEKQLGKEYIASRSGDINNETDFVLNESGFSLPPLLTDQNKQVVLVDHNEPSQIVEAVKNEEIIFVLDHHKLGGLSTPRPISVKIKAVGSTSTLITGLFKEKNVKPSPEIAQIMIAGIISDTLNFSSPTTTHDDKEAVEWLNGFAKIDPDEYATKMFKAKSDITNIPSEELVGKDYKIFEIGGKKIGFGVWETVLPETILERKEEIIKVLAEKKAKEGLDLIFFADVDIINNEAYFIISSGAEKNVGEKAFSGSVENGVMRLKGVVSRKSQMIPPLEKYFSQ